MVINIFIGFVLPWIFGIWLFKKNKRIILFIVPAACMIAFAFNDIGVSSGFWDLKPLNPEDESVSALPLNIGIYPIVSCFMIYISMNKKINPFLMILSCGLILTVGEYIAYLTGKAVYANGWNIFYTFLSYVSALTLVYAYYHCIRSIVPFGS